MTSRFEAMTSNPTLNLAPFSRWALDGLPLHIVQHGHNRDACFLNEQKLKLRIAVLLTSF